MSIDPTQTTTARQWVIEAWCKVCTGNGKGHTGAPHPKGWRVVKRYATERARDSAFGRLVFDKAKWPTRKGFLP